MNFMVKVKIPQLGYSNNGVNKANSIGIVDKISAFPQKPQMYFHHMLLIINTFGGQNCNFAAVFVVRTAFLFQIWSRIVGLCRVKV